MTEKKDLVRGGRRWVFFFFFNPNATREAFGTPHENMPIHVFRQCNKKLPNSISYLPTPDVRLRSWMTTTALYTWVGNTQKMGILKYYLGQERRRWWRMNGVSRYPGNIPIQRSPERTIWVSTWPQVQVHLCRYFNYYIITLVHYQLSLTFN